MILMSAIRFCGTQTVLACDGQCNKAWGINRRPCVQLSSDPDDYAWLADGELKIAPVNPGTYEGGDAKPTDYDDPRRHNRWCARECERKRLIQIGVLNLPDFSKRVYNKPAERRQTQRWDQSRGRIDDPM